ncbi:MAG: hypothetical protein AAGJ68_14385, partial [Pseudomonadota bacterium]
MRLSLIAGASVLALAGCETIETDASVAETPDVVAEAVDAVEEIVEIVAPAPVPLIDRAAFFGNPERTQGRISPDGSYISW